MIKPSIIAEASANIMHSHISSLQEQLRLDERALVYTNAVAYSEEDTPESILINERALKEFLYDRIEFNKAQLPLLQEAYDKICKFIQF